MKNIFHHFKQISLKQIKPLFFTLNNNRFIIKCKYRNIIIYCMLNITDSEAIPSLPFWLYYMGITLWFGLIFSWISKKYNLFNIKSVTGFEFCRIGWLVSMLLPVFAVGNFQIYNLWNHTFGHVLELSNILVQAPVLHIYIIPLLVNMKRKLKKILVKLNFLQSQ